MSQKQVLRMARGDAAGWEFAATDPRTGDPVDLTGAAIRFTAKRKNTDDDDDAVIVHTVSDGISVTDDVNGIFQLRLETDDTDDLTKATTLLWDVQITSGGQPLTVAFGELVIRPDVGRTVP